MGEGLFKMAALPLHSCGLEDWFVQFSLFSSKGYPPRCCHRRRGGVAGLDVFLPRLEVASFRSNLGVSWRGTYDVVFSRDVRSLPMRRRQRASMTQPLKVCGSSCNFGPLARSWGRERFCEAGKASKAPDRSVGRSSCLQPHALQARALEEELKASTTPVVCAPFCILLERGDVSRGLPHEYEQAIVPCARECGGRAL